MVRPKNELLMHLYMIHIFHTYLLIRLIDYWLRLIDS